MTDRRPHWDDALIETVAEALWRVDQPGYRGGIRQRAFALIAAVEDYWHDKGWGDITQSPIEVAIPYNAVEARAEKAEAALRRVRELPIRCGFQRAAWLVHPDAAEDRHTPKWFCVVHLCWSSTPDLCPLQRAEAQVQRVWELHYPVRDEEMTAEGPREIEHCNECGYIYDDGEPCPTIRALDGDGDE